MQKESSACLTQIKSIPITVHTAHIWENMQKEFMRNDMQMQFAFMRY